MGYHHAMEIILAAYDVNIDAKDRYGSTLLHRAAEKGHQAIVRLLLDYGSTIVD
jgi:ankyrin repeat protein